MNTNLNFILFISLRYMYFKDRIEIFNLRNSNWNGMFLPFTLLIKVLNNNKSQEKLGVQALEETLEPVTEPLPSEICRLWYSCVRVKWGLLDKLWEPFLALSTTEVFAVITAVAYLSNYICNLQKLVACFKLPCLSVLHPCCCSEQL